MTFSSDIVVFDLEASCKTYGNNEIEESNIIEMGAVKLDKKSLEIKNEFSVLVKPKDFQISPEITEITNITNEMTQDKPYFDYAAKQFIEWYGTRNKAILSGWGLYYDLPLLRKEFRNFGLDYNKYFVGGGLDIKALGYYWLARNGFSTTGVTVGKLLEKMKIETNIQQHRALDDAKATALIFQNIMRH